MKFVFGGSKVSLLTAVELSDFTLELLFYIYLITNKKLQKKKALR